MTPRRALLSAVLIAVLAFGSRADDFPSLTRGFDPQKSYDFGAIDSINVFNGNLIVPLSIGMRYPLNGGFTYGLSLTYNSKVWDVVDAGGGLVHATPVNRSNAGMGWLLSMGRFIGRDDPLNSLHNGYVYESPDGADHPFEKTNVGSTNCQANDCFPMYTNDGSELRLRRLDQGSSPTSTVEVDSPDGVTRRFVKNGTEWQLTQIRSAASSDIVTVSRPSPLAYSAQCPGANSMWLVTDTQGRSQYVCFKNRDYGGITRPMADRVVLLAPQDPVTHGARTATWLFDYGGGNVQIPKGGEDTDGSNTWTQSYSLPFLKALKLPDGATDAFGLSDCSDCSTYQFFYSYGTPFSGVLQQVVLPTGGKVTYDYTYFSFPSWDMCANHYGVGYGVGGSSPGVMIRSFKTPSDTLIGKWIYSHDLLPAAGYVANTLCGADTNLPLHPIVSDEMVVTVMEPSGDKVKSHFSMWPSGTDDPDTSPAGFKYVNFNDPYGAYDATQDRYLSQETLHCDSIGNNCSVLRSTYIRQGVEKVIVSSRTAFRDDPPGCTPTGAAANCHYTGSELSEWDGYGHHRTAQSNGLRTGLLNGVPTEVSEQRTAHTNYNPGSDTNGLVGGSMLIPPDKNWVLNTYDSVTTTDAAGQTTQQYCFDQPTGFLKANRILKGTSLQPSDLLAVFTRETGTGNLSQELYYGGDTGSISTDPNLCTAMNNPGSLAYEIDHTWDHGAAKTTKHIGGGISFFDLNVTTDATGLVTSSADPSNLSTTFGYDRLGRLSSISPPGESASTIQFSSASHPQSVQVTRSGIATKYEYDDFGRVFRATRDMPAGSKSVQTTSYDAMGRKTAVSEWVTQGAAVVPLTQFQYDTFGRTTQITPPDDLRTPGLSTKSVITYQGNSTIARTVQVRTGTDGGGNATFEPAMTTERYDSFGRLVSVTEPNGTLTTYNYDTADHLTFVGSNAGSGGTYGQTRTFNYDGRGLLFSETHPENGSFSYTYDARGHVLSRTRSDISAFNLQYSYDLAERPVRLDSWSGAAYRPFKEYAYDASDATNHGLGKLATATRHNYIPGSSDDYLVTEQFLYRDDAGHLTDKNTTITLPGGSLRTVTQSQSYDALGMPATTTYPSCTANCGAAAWNTVSNSYDEGFLTSVSTSGGPITNPTSSLSYWPSGMLHTIPFAGAQTDTIGIDINTMIPRPSLITFGSFAACTPATIAIPPQSMTVSSNQPATLSVTASGTASISYQWYDAATSTAITGATSSTYQTPPITTARTFYVVVFNSCGRKQSSVVTVSTCVTQITGQPQGSTIGFNNSAPLSVSATGGPLSYQWYRGVAPDTSSPVGANSASFQTPSLTQSTAYWVRVTGCSGTVDSTTAWVLIQLAAPSSLQATMVVGDPAHVRVTWNSVPGAAGYRVERRAGGVWGAPVPVSASPFTDSAVPGNSYVYRVTAVDNSPGGNPSLVSNLDLATTISFAAISGLIQYDHVEQLRSALNAVRAANGDPALSWPQLLIGSNTAPVPGHDVGIYAAHVRALRSEVTAALGRLCPAGSSCGFATQPSFTDPTLTTSPPVFIKAIHFTQLQDVVR